MKIYVARDEGYTLYEYENDDRGIHIDGELHIFYDTPLKEFVDGTYCDNLELGYYKSGHWAWKCAREMTSNVPTYMFPEIEEGKCIEFISNER